VNHAGGFCVAQGGEMWYTMLGQTICYCDPMHNAITDFLRTSHTCLLLVHPAVSKLEGAAAQLLSVYSWPRLSVGGELSAVLFSETSQRRSRAARQWMKVHFREMAPGPVLCTEIDLLFEPTLKLDPLRLMRDVGRVTRLVVTWPGSYVDNVLAYAVPGHSHYRTWRRPEVFIKVLE